MSARAILQVMASTMLYKILTGVGIVLSVMTPILTVPGVDIGPDAQDVDSGGMLCPDCWHELHLHDQNGCSYWWKAGRQKETCRCNRQPFRVLEVIDVGIMDTVREQTRPTSEGFLSKDDRATMVETKQPFNIVRMTRGTSPKFNKPQWYVDIEFLDQSGNLILVPDDEEGQAPVRRCVTFNASDSRDREFPVLEQMRLEKGGALGPLKLERVTVQNQPNPAYIFRDWEPDGLPVQNVQAIPTTVAPPPPPAPPSRPRSEDGLYEWDGTKWVPSYEAQPPPPPSAPPPPDVVPATLPSSAAGVSQGAPESAAKLPPIGVSQPLPELAGIATGGDGEGGTVSVPMFKGDQIRMAVYRGEGKVQTPSGGLVQAVSAEDEKKVQPLGQVVDPSGKFMLVDGKWVPLPPVPSERAETPEPELLPQTVSAESARQAAQQETAASGGGIAQEAASRAAATQAQEPVQAIPTAVPAAQIPANETPAAKPKVPMSGKCDTCGKTVRGQSFKNSKGRWIITHTCDAPDPQHPGQKIGSKTIDVNDQVMSILEEAKKA